jgi:integrase/predicted DNA-binding transcriptional regulator AlpA
MPEVPEQKFLTARQLSDRSGFSLSWIYRRSELNATDSIPCHRIGRSIRYDEQEFAEWMESHRTPVCDSLSPEDGDARDRRLRKMSRKRFQKGHVRERGRKIKYWEGSWREYQPDRHKPERRSKKLGLKSEMSYKEAERALNEILRELNSPDYMPESAMTLEEFWQKYKELVLPNRKHSTQTDMISTFGRDVLPEFGKIEMRNFNKEKLQMFFNRLSRKLPAWNSRKKVKIYLSSVFTAAVEYNYLRKNLVRSVDLGEKPVAKQPQLPRVEELQKIEAALPEGKYRMLFRLVWATGARPGEISALRCGAADLQKGRIWILEAVYRDKLGSPKTHRSVRPVYLDQDTLELLRAYKQRFLLKAKDEDFVFPSARGKTPVSYLNVLNRWIRPLWKKLGLTRTNWLLLRHWAGTEGANNAVPPKALQEQLGHASIMTTMKYYVHVDEEQGRKAAEVIGRRIGGIQPSASGAENSPNFDDTIDDTDRVGSGVKRASHSE